MENKNCLNCKNHIDIIVDPNGPFHMHDYCTFWCTEIPYCYAHEKWCEKNCPHKDEDGYPDGPCDGCSNHKEDYDGDVSEGVTYCYAFEPKEEKK